MLTNFNALRLEVARNTNRHVKKTLPPSISGLPGEAEIIYFVKVTVQRPAFYKENFRSVSTVTWWDGRRIETTNDVCEELC